MQNPQNHPLNVLQKKSVTKSRLTMHLEKIQPLQMPDRKDSTWNWADFSNTNIKQQKAFSCGFSPFTFVFLLSFLFRVKIVSFLLSKDVRFSFYFSFLSPKSAFVCFLILCADNLPFVWFPNCVLLQCSPIFFRTPRHLFLDLRCFSNA